MARCKPRSAPDTDEWHPPTRSGEVDEDRLPPMPSAERPVFGKARHSPHESSFHKGLRATSLWRFQMSPSTLCVNSILGQGTSHGIPPAATRKSQTITSFVSICTNFPSSRVTRGWQYLLI